MNTQALRQNLATGLLYFLSIGVAGYAIFAYAALPLGSLVHPEMKSNFQAHAIFIYLHIFASSIALLIGPFQFSKTLRMRFLRVHRWSGRVYLGLGVLLGGISGLFMATLAYGGLMSNLGFGFLAVLWLYTGIRAYIAIRQGQIQAHRKWMIRNFSLTLAAVCLRIYLPISMISGIPFALSYPVISWLCWVPNLLLAEWLFIRDVQE